MIKIYLDSLGSNNKRISKLSREGYFIWEVYYRFSAEGGIFGKYLHLKKAGKIGSSAFSVINALIKLN